MFPTIVGPTGLDSPSPARGTVSPASNTTRSDSKGERGQGKGQRSGEVRRTVEHHHRALAGGRELRLADRVLEVRDEVVDHRHGEALCVCGTGPGGGSPISTCNRKQQRERRRKERGGKARGEVECSERATEQGEGRGGGRDGDRRHRQIKGMKRGREDDGARGRTVTAMWTAAGLLIPFRCQPFWLMASPTSSTLSSTPCAAANATTDAGGFPSTRSSGISVRMRCAIVFAAETMLRQDSR